LLIRCPNHCIVLRGPLNGLQDQSAFLGITSSSPSIPEKELLLVERTRRRQRLWAGWRGMDCFEDALPRRNRLRGPPAQARDRRGGERHAEITSDGAIAADSSYDGAAFDVNSPALGSRG
jgi:hypothetical protein